MIDLEIREIQKEEIHQMKKLRDYAFRTSSGGGEEDFFYWMDHGNRLGAFKDNELAAQVVTYPLEVMLFGERYQMGGIAYVATYPEHRRGGLIRQLMTKSIEAMKEKGQIVSYLQPFDVRFYRKFGYELGFHMAHLHLKLDQFVRKSSGIGQIKRINHSSPEFAFIKEVYHQYSSAHQGMLVRDEAWWARLTRRGFTKEMALYFDENGEAKGYLSFGFEGTKMIIRELIALTSEAENELWAFISSHDSMFDIVELENTGDIQELALGLTNPTALKVEEELSYMLRIVDVKEFLRRYPFKKHEKPLYIRVTDEVAPFNSGVYKIEAGVLQENDNGETYENLLEIEIGTLSQMLLGAVRPRMLNAYHKITASEETINLLEAIIPQTSPRFYDHF